MIIGIVANLLQNPTIKHFMINTCQSYTQDESDMFLDSHKSL